MEYGINVANLAGGGLNVLGVLDHDGSSLGFYGVTPAVRSTGYVMTNKTLDKTLNCDSTTVAEVADVLATLIDDLKNIGLIG